VCSSDGRKKMYTQAILPHFLKVRGGKGRSSTERPHRFLTCVCKGLARSIFGLVCECVCVCECPKNSSAAHIRIPKI
jgi:hypothetical protein